MRVRVIGEQCAEAEGESEGSVTSIRREQCDEGQGSLTRIRVRARAV